MKPGEYYGEWWLPKSPNSKIKGKLVISLDELILYVEGDFVDRVFPDLFPKISFVHGKINNSDLILTLNNLTMILHGKTSGYITVKLDVEYIF